MFRQLDAPINHRVVVEHATRHTQLTYKRMVDIGSGMFVFSPLILVFLKVKRCSVTSEPTNDDKCITADDAHPRTEIHRPQQRSDILYGVSHIFVRSDFPL